MKQKVSIKHDPFEIVIVIVFGVSAFLQLLGPPVPAAASAAQIDHTSLMLWLSLMAGGCLTVIVGLLSPYVWGYLVEQVGLVAVGGALISYGIQITLIQIQHHLLSPVTIAGGPLLICLGMGFIWKMNQVKRDVDVLALHNGNGHDER